MTHDGDGFGSEAGGRVLAPFVYREGEALMTGTQELGLGVARILVDGMGGEISYRREQAEPRFLVGLPLAEYDQDAQLEAGLA